MLGIAKVIDVLESASRILDSQAELIADTIELRLNIMDQGAEFPGPHGEILAGPSQKEFAAPYAGTEHTGEKGSGGNGEGNRFFETLLPDLSDGEVVRPHDAHDFIREIPGLEDPGDLIGLPLIGGVAVIAFIAIAFFFVRRRRHQ